MEVTPTPRAGPLERLAEGTMWGPKRGKCSWAAGRTQDQLGGGGSPGIGCSLSYLHLGSSFHSDDSHVPSDPEASPSQQRLAFTEAALPLSGFLVPKASTYYFQWGGSPGLGLHQGEQQRLEIRQVLKTSSQVLTIYLHPLPTGACQACGRSRLPEGVGERAGVDTEEESLAEVHSSQKMHGREAQDQWSHPFILQGGRKQSLLCSRLHSQCWINPRSPGFETALIPLNPEASTNQICR